MSVLKDYNDAVSNDRRELRRSSNTYEKVAQTITVTDTYSVTSAEFRLYRALTPGGNIWAELWEANGSHFPTTKLATSNTMNPNDIPYTSPYGDYVEFEFPKPAIVTNGQIYALVLNGDYPMTNDNYVNVCMRANSYGPGCHLLYVRDAVNWSKNCSYDFQFKLYGGRWKISGNLQMDADLYVIQNDVVVSSGNFSAGAYEIDAHFETEATIVAVSDTFGPLVYSGITPISV